jgi:signal peptidase I
MDHNDNRGIIRAILLAIACAMLIKLFFVDLMITQGRSMLPTLKPGSMLVINKVAYGFRIPGLGVYLFRWSLPQPGDMVVFYTPLGERAVKRCYYIDEEGGIFARGDNDLESFDSRSYGPVTPDDILGKVVAFK